ncbi:MAG: ATP synthase F1 subunit delta [Bacteroidetes bacterium]|jgi:F-type H+-transporting ATPase subunit delta|nr:ATP synthase F1 subunit delta [Bacteroidota bacterium]
MNYPKVAIRYAKSLMELAESKGSVDAAMADMSLIENTIKANKELVMLLSSPVVDMAKKEKVLMAIFGDKISDISKDFVQLITRKGREGDLLAIADRFIALVKERRNIHQAVVTSATPLTAAAKTELLGMVQKIKAGEVELTEKIDPSIIGGFILRVDDSMIDASVLARFRKLRQDFSVN